MKNLFLTIIILILKKDISGRDFRHFNYEDCPLVGCTTATKPIIKIKINPSLKKWPDLATFVFKRENERIFIYNPFKNLNIMENRRFKIKREKFSLNFNILIKFFPDDDSGVDFEFGYLENKYKKFTPFCSVMINEDMTPQATLMRRPALESGQYDKTDYLEGESIIVICKVIKLTLNDYFFLIFPPNTNEVFDKSEINSKQYVLTLKQEIKGKNICCLIPNGFSACTTDFLQFTDKPLPEQEPNRAGTAIVISVFFALILAVMIIFGGYTLIIKQRHDTTKKMVEHHVDKAKTDDARMKTQLTRMSMNRESRTSRMSRMSRSTRSSRLSRSNILKHDTTDHVYIEKL